jgi:hypothetical protein
MVNFHRMINTRQMGALIVVLRVIWVVVRLILVLYVGSGQAGNFFYQGF